MDTNSAGSGHKEEKTQARWYNYMMPDLLFFRKFQIVLPWPAICHEEQISRKPNIAVYFQSHEHPKHASEARARTHQKSKNTKKVTKHPIARREWALRKNEAWEKSTRYIHGICKIPLSQIPSYLKVARIRSTCHVIRKGQRRLFRTKTDAKNWSNNCA